MGSFNKHLATSSPSIKQAEILKQRHKKDVGMTKKQQIQAHKSPGAFQIVTRTL